MDVIREKALKKTIIILDVDVELKKEDSWKCSLPDTSERNGK